MSTCKRSTIPTWDHEPKRKDDREGGPEEVVDGREGSVGGAAESGVVSSDADSAVAGPVELLFVSIVDAVDAVSGATPGLSCGVLARSLACRLARLSAADKPWSTSPSAEPVKPDPTPSPLPWREEVSAVESTVTPLTTMFRPNPENLAGLVLYRNIRGRSMLAIRIRVVPLGLSCASPPPDPEPGEEKSDPEPCL